MRFRYRIVILVLILSAAVLAVGGSAISILYETSLEQQRVRLTETASSQARLLEAMARYNFSHLTGELARPRQEAVEAIIGQIRDAHENYRGFGETSEFTLARRDGDQIIFLLSHRYDDLDKPRPVPMDAEFAEPMRRALNGRSGTGILLDYRGVKVLAAFEPVGVIDLGIVAKIDLAEIRAPFVRAGAVVIAIAVIMIVAGTYLFFRVSTPVIRRLADSEERFRRSFEESRIGMIIVDMDFCIQDANAQMCEILGYSRSELTGMAIEEITHPDDMALTLAGSERAKNTPEQTYSLEKRYLRKDGRIVWARLHSALVRDADGKPSHFSSQIEDITAKKLAEEALRESESNLRLITDSLPVQIAFVDTDQRYRFVNAAYEKRFGRPRDRIIGRTIEAMVGAINYARVGPHVERALGGETVRYEMAVTPRDTGEFKVQSGICVPRLGAGGGVEGVYLLSEDITERKMNELAAVRAKQEAEAANRTKSEFLANISHELRTPLNAIIGFSDALKNGLFGKFANENQAEYIDAIHESGNHLLELINDVLDVSAIEAGKLDLHEVPLDLPKIAEAAIRMVQQRAENGGIALINEINSESQPIIADELRMKQVLVNLLSNAVKFTPEGGRVTLGAGTKDDGSLCISVIDTGIGMDAATLTKAMSAFGRADNIMTRETEGTGLGLPLVKGLVEAHGGTLTIESAPGAGTTVLVNIPKERIVLA